MERLVMDFELPDHWDPGVMKPTYRLLMEIITAVEDGGLLMNDTLPRILYKLAPGYKVGKVSNFVRKIRRQKPDKLDVIFPFINQSAIIGPHCTAAGVTEQWLSGSGDLPVDVRVTNAIVCELNDYRARNNHTWNMAHRWICGLLKVEDQPAIGTIQTLFSLLAKRKDRLRTNKTKLAEFLESEYRLPKKTEEVRRTTAVKHMMEDNLVSVDQSNNENSKGTQSDFVCTEEQDELDEITDKYVKALENLEELRIQMDELKNKWQSERKQKQIMAKELKVLTKQFENKVKTIDSLREKISRYTPRNVTKRENRLKNTNSTLTSNINELKAENLEIKSKLEAIKKEKWNNSKLARYYKDDRNKLKGEKSCKSCDAIKTKYNEILEYASNLESKLEEMTEVNETRMIKTYEHGHYNDKVVKLYMDLLTKYNVGARNATGVVKEVLSQLGGLEAERLPKYTWITQVIIRARTLSQIQILEELLGKSNNTLHLDGTSKKGEHYGTYDVSTSSGTYVLGLRDMTGGTASKYYTTFDDIVTDIAGVLNDDSKSLNKSRIVSSMKNMMTDRCVVNTKFCELLESSRLEHILKVVENWTTLTAEQKDKVLEVNDLYCGLHYLVGLADNAENAPKIWEGIVATEPLGAMAKGFRSSKGESGTQRLIRTSVKAFEEHGCEASGVMGPFDNFLTGKGIDCKLKPFRGNRFNILFEDGGAVFYHHDHMTEFILKNCPSPNRLIKAVMADLAEDVLLAGARALGIINHKLTTPLWTVLESKIHIFDMNEKYRFIVDKLNAWVTDPSELLKVACEDDELSKVLVPPVDDEVSRALYSPNIPEDICLLTSEALSLMCAAMARVSERMLVGHLSGSKWENPSEELKEQTRTVPTTNIASEHDFGQLDRLKREKPNANTIALEALIMYVTNHTSQWFTDLPMDKQKHYLTIARKSAPSVRLAFYEQRKKNKEQLTEQRLEKERLKKEKEVKKQTESENLTRQLAEYGGLWTEEEVEEKVAKLKMAKQKELGLKAQLQFRHKVMQQTTPDNSLWHLTKGGKRNQHRT